MKLSSMRFKDFVWPHNPAVYAISYSREMAVHKVPFGRYRLQSLGLTRRVMKGEGEFAGADAYGQFKALASVFYEDTPGVLVHPLWDTASAWFVSLELEQQPREDYVKYRFAFWEDCAGLLTGVERQAVSAPESGEGGPAAAHGEAVYHTVAQGETLWGIAAGRGIALAQLVGLNPQIRNPNLIYPGQKVRVS